MKQIIDFIRSKYAPVLALLLLVLSFFQLYAKLYYHVTPLKTEIYFLDVIVIPVIAGLGLCSVTLIILVHSRNPYTPFYFALMDFLIGFTFFGKRLYEHWEKNDWVAMATVLFLPLMKASAIYFLAEIFVRQAEQEEEENELWEKEKNDSIQEIQRLQSEIQRLQSDLTANVEESRLEAERLTALVEEGQRRLTASAEDEQKISEQLNQELEALRVQTESVERERNRYRGQLESSQAENASLHNQLEELQAMKEAFMEDKKPDKIRGTLRGLRANRSRVENQITGEQNEDKIREMKGKLQEYDLKIQQYEALLNNMENGYSFSVNGFRGADV